MNLSITAGKAVLEDNTPGLSLKIQGDSYEINVWFREEEIEKLKQVKNKAWESGSLQIGKCANNDVYWACDNGNISVLVGNDDEVWDFGVFIPEYMIDEILNEIQENT